MLSSLRAALFLIACALALLPPQRASAAETPPTYLPILPNCIGELIGSGSTTNPATCVNLLGTNQIVSGNWNFSGANTHSGLETFSGGLNYTGMGALSVASAQDRATYKGVRYDARSDFGLACDDVTDDSMAFNAMLTAKAATSTPVKITFPGTCLVTYATHTISGALSFEGVNGGGLKLAAGATMTGSFINWSTPSADILINNFTLDLNSAVPSGVATALYAGIGGDFTMRDSTIKNAAAPTSGNGLILLAGYGLNSCTFENNVFRFNSPSTYQNQSINLGTSLSPVNHCNIIKNHSIKTSIAAFYGDNLDFLDNEVEGWAFGAGISVGAGGVTTVTHIKMSGDNIHDSAATPDINNFPMTGIENWFNNAVITGETIRNTCGPGIYLGGTSTVTGNRVSNSGSCNTSLFGNSGIVATSSNGSSGSKSFIDGNTVWDDAGTTSYGYSDIGTTSGVVLGVNDFQGVVGSYNIVGASTFAASQIDNRIVNPCGQIDQRNNGAGIVSGKGADQWQITESVGHIPVYSGTAAMGQCRYGITAYTSSMGTPSASDYGAVFQNIASNDVLDFGFGSSSARPLIFAFCASINFTPPFTGSFSVYNQSANYSWVNNYTVSKTGYQCFSYRIQGDQSHSLAGTGPVTSIRVDFDVSSGANNKTSTLGSWVSGNAYGSTTATSLSTLPVNSSVTWADVRLLPASSDNGWTPKTTNVEIANAQRFYRMSFPFGTSPTQNAGTAGSSCVYSPVAASEPSVTIPFGQPMNSLPTITTLNPSAANANWRDTTTSADVTATVPTTATSVNGFTIGSSATSALADLLCIQWTADAEQ